MPNVVDLHTEIDKDTSEQATKALAAMGLTMAEAIDLFVRRVAEEQRLPFVVKRELKPSGETLQAMYEVESGEGEKFATVNDLLADLNEND